MKSTDDSPRTTNNSATTESRGVSIDETEHDESDVAVSEVSGVDSNKYEGVFTPSQFQKRYQRNNKRGGLKNLRCFPLCGPQHKERGFCGRPVVVSLAEKGGQSDIYPFMCWAQFVPRDDHLRISVGTQLPLITIASMERSKESPLQPLMRGKLLQASDLEQVFGTDVPSHTIISSFGFNLDMKGWHYGWASNKHSCNAEHCLQVYVFEIDPNTPLSLIDMSVSSEIRDELVNISSPFPQALGTSKETAESSSRPTTTKPTRVKQEPDPGPPVAAAASSSKGKPSVDTSPSARAKEILAQINCPDVNPETIVFRCCTIVRSPSFQLFCRRRRRFVLEPTAPLAAPKGRSSSSSSGKKKNKQQRSVAAAAGKTPVAEDTGHEQFKAQIEKQIQKQLRQLKKMQKQIKSSSSPEETTRLNVAKMGHAASIAKLEEQIQLLGTQEQANKLADAAKRKRNARTKSKTTNRARSRSTNDISSFPSRLEGHEGLETLAKAGNTLGSHHGSSGSSGTGEEGTFSLPSSGSSSPTNKRPRAVSDNIVAPPGPGEDDAINLLLGFSKQAS